MSTKNLARTVIEGGRRNIEDRRESNRNLRVSERNFLHVVKRAEDADEVDAPTPKRHPVPRKYGFTDKLSPVWRYLDAQVGRPWRLVLKELVKKFPMSGLAGQHVVNQHIIGQIVGAGGSEGRPKDPAKDYFRQTYYIDHVGLLKKFKKEKKKKYPFNGSYLRRLLTKRDHEEMAKWLNGRKVLLGKDNTMYWALPTEKVLVKTKFDTVVRAYLSWSRLDNTIHWYVVDRNGNKLKVTPWYDPKVMPPDWIYSGTWRQSKPASIKDVEYYNSWTEEVRKFITVALR